MTRQESATPDYTMGFSEEFLKSLRRSTADTNAAFLLPYLRPGLHVLDFGCGPGAISVGLARAVAPGELHGVDMEESQIELARSVAEANGLDNATFHVGDVTEMPFENGSFDVAYCHNVLMHVPDTRAVLAEVQRVLKPGGLIACREMITRSSFTHPDFDAIRSSWSIFEGLIASDDGHPQMGKYMKGHIINAGFANIRMTASFNVYSAPDDMVFIRNLISKWYLSPEITEAAIKYGLATEDLFERMRIAFERWKDHPDAWVAVAYGEAVANKPLL